MNKRALIVLIRKAFSRKIVMDYEPDNDPENWRTINHAKVHLNGEGQIDGGAGGKFSGKAWTSEKHPHKSVKSSNGNGKMSTGGGGMNTDYRVKGNEITQGSEKQINWAKNIQSDFVNGINEEIDKINEREKQFGVYPDADEWRTAYRLYGESFEKNSKGKPASWYIDNRAMLDPVTTHKQVNNRVLQMKEQERRTGKTLKQLWNERKST